MRITSVGASGRAAYYDRNPTAITALTYAADAVGPHGGTVRATYTVPTGRKAFVESTSAAMMRTAAGGAVGICDASIAVLAANRINSVIEFDNTVAAKMNGNSGGGIALTGAVIQISTLDASTTTSAHSFRLGAQVTEYDA